MNPIKKILIETFGFNKTEMNATWLLLTLIILVAVFPRYYVSQYKDKIELNLQQQEELNNWSKEIEASLAFSSTKPDTRHFRPDYNKEDTREYHNIKQEKTFTQVVMEVEEKGGEYKVNNSKYPAYTASESPVGDFENRSIDLNLASEMTLQQLRGVGPVLSERIVKYRTLLGGFHNLSQLGEVYGLQQEVIDEISPRLILDKIVEQTIPVNSDSLKHLFKHPYIDYKLAKAIVNYRKVHGDYTDASQLKELKLMSDSLYQKIYPYISVASQ